MATFDEPRELSPDEERLLARLIEYDEALARGAETDRDASTADLDPSLAAQLSGGQAVVEWLHKLQPVLDADEGAAAALDDSWAGRWDRLASPAPHTLGERGHMGRFEILRELGRGGHGVVLLARDPQLRRQVALKVPRPEALLTSSMRRRFLREAQAAARLSHPNLVAVHEVGEIGPVCYIAAEYVAGPTLAAWLENRAGAVSPVAAARIIDQLALAVHYAHSQGILHRDLKPGNVLLAPRPREDGAPPDGDELDFVPRVTDFGLAKLSARDSDGDASQTRSGSLLGTPAYMAPEQAAGRIDAVGRATDVYALGAMLHELLCGQAVFRGSTDVDTLHKVMFDEPPALRRLRRDVPADLEAIALRCLEKEPQRRYATCAELATDLQRYLAGEPTLARPLDPTQKLIKFTRRKPAVAALVAVSVLAAVTIASGAAWYTWRLGAALAVSEERRVQAVVALAEAERSRAEAERERDANSEFLYGSRMRLAYQLLFQGDTQQAARLAAAYDDGQEAARLRGFEWQYLKQSLHGERLSLAADPGEAYGVAYSPDGRTLVSGGQDGQIHVWDPRSGARLRSLSGHGSCVNDLSFSPDGRWLASGSCDHTVRLWDTSTWTPLATFTDPSMEVMCLKFSPDGKWLVAGVNRGPAYVWETDSWRLDHKLETRGRSVDAVAWSPDGRRLVTNCNDLGVRLWATATWKEERVVAELSTASEFLADPRYLAISVHTQGVVRICEVATGATRATISGRFDDIESLARSPDGRWLATGGSGRMIKLWDLAPVSQDLAEEDPPRNLVEPTRVLFGHSGRVQDMVFSPDGSSLASASFDGTVKVWSLDSESGELPLRLPLSLPDAFGPYVGLSADLDRLTVVDDARSLAAWDLEERREIRSTPLPPQGAVTVAPDGAHCVAVQRGKDTLLVEDDPRSPGIRTLHGDADAIRSGFSSGGQYLVSVGPTGFDLFDLATDQRLLRHPFVVQPDPATAKVLAVAVSRDGRLLTSSDTGRLLDLRTGESRELDLVGSGGVYFSPDGSLLVAIYSPPLVRLFDTATAQVVRELHPSGATTSLAFSPDGRTLATGTFEGAVAVWHVPTGQEIVSFETRSGVVLALRFSADSRGLAAVACDPATNEPTVHRWVPRARQP